MVDKAFIWDRSQKFWEECHEKSIIEEDITKLPFRLIVGASLPLKEQLIWCPRHNRFERIESDEKDKTNTDCGCIIKGLYVLADSDSDDIKKFKTVDLQPSRWRIYQKEPLFPIFLAGDSARLCFLLKPGTKDNSTELSFARVEWIVRSVSIDIVKDKFICLNHNLEKRPYRMRKPRYGYDYQNKSQLDVPEEITNYIFPFLLDVAKKHYGIEPVKNDPYKGLDKLEKFMSHPLNRNIIPLLQIKYNRNNNTDYFNRYWYDPHPHELYDIDPFPKLQKDIGETVCEYLSISDPPEELVKECSENIYKALNYRLYYASGFRNFSAIKELWENEKFFGKDLLKFRYNDKDKEDSWWKQTADFIAWLIYENDEIAAAKMLQDTYYKKDERVNLEDMLNIFSRSKKRFPKDMLLKFKTEGFTFSNYKMLKDYEFEATYHYKNLNLHDIILGLEENINGYNFRAVRHTLYLRRISAAMESRLEYSWLNVAEYEVYIITVDFKGKYVAYLKIKLDYDRYYHKYTLNIVGLYGIKDAKVNLPIKLICYYWAAMNRLHDPNDVLDLDENEMKLYKRTKYVGKQISETDVVYDNYTAEELLKFPAYTRGEGYYYILFERLEKKSDVCQYSLPPWIVILDEEEYLKYLIPWIEEVFKDAKAENPGAQNLLGYIYFSKRYIPRNNERAIYWLEKAAAHGYAQSFEILAKIAANNGNYEKMRNYMICAAKHGSSSAFNWCVDSVSAVEYAILG